MSVAKCIVKTDRKTVLTSRVKKRHRINHRRISFLSVWDVNYLRKDFNCLLVEFIVLFERPVGFGNRRPIFLVTFIPIMVPDPFAGDRGALRHRHVSMHRQQRPGRGTRNCTTTARRYGTFLAQKVRRFYCLQHISV